MGIPAGQEAFHRVGEVEIDARRRAYFGKVGKPGRRYLVEENAEGVLRLVPLMPPMTKAQFEAEVTRAVEQASKGELHDLGSFAQYLDDEDEED
jgi:hypothetical protein